MIPKRIAGATRYLGAPPGWEPEKDGECSHLAILDVKRGDLPVMISAWEPTPTEIEAMQAGRPIYLQIVGTAHPPVSVWVDTEQPPQKLSIADSALLAKWAGRIEVLLDGALIDRVIEYDVEAGTVTRYRLNEEGRVYVVDGAAAEETLRGQVEVRRCDS